MHVSWRNPECFTHTVLFDNKKSKALLASLQPFQNSLCLTPVSLA